MTHADYGATGDGTTDSPWVLQTPSLQSSYEAHRDEEARYHAEMDKNTLGEVTDFLEFYVGSYYWPAFNVADSAITIGAACLILDELMRVRKTR